MEIINTNVQNNNAILNDAIINIENVSKQGLQITFSPSRRKAVKKINVCIEGEFTVNNITLITAKIKSLFNYYEVVNVLLKSITRIDLSAIQFVYVMKHFYSLSQCKIEFEAELSKEDLQLINNGGFSSLFSKPFLTQ